MIKHESAFDLFQRINIKNENKYDIIIERLNHYHKILFPNGFNKQGQLIELLDDNRIITKTFLHGFLSDYIEYMKYRNELLNLPFKSEDEILLNSPQAYKDSNDSEIPTLQLKCNYNQSIIFLYIDTEYKECSFNSEFIQWYDCETSSELISTLLRFEQSCFITNPNQQYILIIDSSTQVPNNDYFNMTTLTHVMSIEENKLLTVQWHNILCHLLMKYKLPCIIIEHLDIDIPMFDRIISKRDEKLIKRNSKNKELHIPFSEFAFGRLMNSEHYMNDWNNQLEYRQIHSNDMINFHYEPKHSSSSISLSNDEKMDDNDGNIS